MTSSAAQDIKTWAAELRAKAATIRDGDLRVVTEALVVLTEQREQLKAKLAATRRVLGYREAELLTLKGPCSTANCRLHHAHSGPCDIRTDAIARGDQPQGESEDEWCFVACPHEPSHR